VITAIISARVIPLTFANWKKVTAFSWNMALYAYALDGRVRFLAG
jgi:hypothetical protein